MLKFPLEFYPEAKIDVTKIFTEITQQFFLLPREECLRIMLAPGEEVVGDWLAEGDRYDLLLLDAFEDNGPAIRKLNGSTLI